MWHQPSAWTILFNFFIFITTVSISFAETTRQKYTEEQRLLYHLLQNYERSVRPVRNASHTVTVKLGMTLTNVFEMDEKNQVLTINVWLNQEWTDELLRWDPKDFSNIHSIRIPCDLLWLPDIVLYNNADDYTEGLMRSRAMVYWDGTVFWPPPTQLRSTCKIDVTYFPFDTQHCSLKFGSWTYHGFQVDVTNRSLNIDLGNYVESGEFELVRVHQLRRVLKYTCCPEPYPDVTFFLHLRRKILYYTYNVIFPCMMMSALTLLVFWLPPDSGEKIALGITVLLAFSVFVLAIAEKMPETSDSMPLIGIYLTAVMGLTSVSVVMTVMVLNFHHSGPFNRPVPKWARRIVLEYLRKFLRIKLSSALHSDLPTTSTANGLMRRMSVKLALDEFNEDIFDDLDLQLIDLQQETTTFIENESGNNGAASATATIVRKKRKKPSELHAKLLRTLQVLIRRQELEDGYQVMANEWRQVAQVVDRLLFFIFLIATVSISLVLLIILPVLHRAMESEELNLELYGVQ